jgi:hypothetical protein
MRDYYTPFEIFVAWIKKLLGIKSPSAIYISEGKYEYAYDFIMKTKRRGE